MEDPTDHDTQKSKQHSLPGVCHLNPTSAVGPFDKINTLILAYDALVAGI